MHVKDKYPEWKNRSVAEWDRFREKTVAEEMPKWHMQLITGNHKTPYHTLVEEGMVPQWIQRLKNRELDEFFFAEQAKEFDALVLDEWLEPEDAAKEFDLLFSKSVDADFDSMVVDAWLNT